ncbi:hypothetical protein RHSIM_Rhsim06G0059100 [Rhododendron simsii]|uniref:Uncharacterized protein n=1 Tax=Rhododendron simsii TaxID=118357 RepID=A0A834LN51_RHOSS|nr:hypothetical protein RHSIM_Rhsim06G0059100 [Rhododendron simsii]
MAAAAALSNCAVENTEGRKGEKKKSDFPPEEFVRAQKVREHLFGVKFRRSITFQEYTEYHETIKLSEGFDIGNAPDDIDFQQMYLRPVEDIAMLALDKYNEDNLQKYQFVKFLKANYTSSIRALEYYITFEAKDVNGWPPRVFLATLLEDTPPPNAGCALGGGFGLSLSVARAVEFSEGDAAEDEDDTDGEEDVADGEETAPSSSGLY